MLGVEFTGAQHEAGSSKTSMEGATNDANMQQSDVRQPDDDGEFMRQSCQDGIIIQCYPDVELTTSTPFLLPNDDFDKCTPCKETIFTAYRTDGETLLISKSTEYGKATKDRRLDPCLVLRNPQTTNGEPLYCDASFL